MRSVISLFGIFLLLFSLFLAAGCGSSDGGLSDWQKEPTVTLVSNIKGKILPPPAGVSVRGAFSLLSTEGALVFVEDRPDLFANADANGDFIIRNVPAGPVRLVAHKVSGSTPYRQRSDLINLSGKYETQVVAEPIVLENAPYSINVTVSDVFTGALLSAKIKVWGFEFNTVSGTTDVGPFPGGIGSKEVRVEAVGYIGATFLIGFSDTKKAKLYVKLTPTTSTSGNRAPFVEIEHAAASVRTNESISLSASGIDADGDPISWSWTTVSGGKFSNSNGASTIYTAPAASGVADITLTGRDDDGAEGKAVLRLVVEQGGAIGANPHNRPPLAAYDPVPVNLSEDQSDGTVLRWAAADPDGDAVNFDILFAAQGSDLKVVAGRQTAVGYKVSGLLPFKTYFWQIITRDIYEAVTASPIWQFKTGDLNNFAPYAPALPVPEDLTINQLPTTLCTWTGGDPDADDIVTYSFMLGTDKNALQLKGKTRQTSLQLDSLSLGSTYYWQILAADDRGKETAGPVWRFSVHSPNNQVPADPVAVYPASGAAGIAVNAQLRWSAGDPDGDAVTSDVFFGTAFPLPRVAASTSAQVYLPSETLQANTNYYWQIVVRDARGAVNANSPVWSFSTLSLANQPPNQPLAVSPASGSIGVSRRPVIAWTGGDPDDSLVYFDLLLDAAAPPAVKIAGNLTVTNWTPQVDLTPGKKYFWQVIARDAAGNTASSSVYSFTVIADSEVDSVPPTILSVTPENGAINVATDAAVKVIFSEPVDKTAALAALSFVPEVAGAWSWDNDATLRFWPKNGWLPGSYNRLVIADNKVKDLNNNIMSRGATYSFTFSSAIPVPSGCRSLAFPIEISANQTMSVAVPGLVAGSKSWAVAVASPDAATFTVRANRRLSLPVDVDPHSAFRFFESEMKAQLPASVLSGVPGLRASVVSVSPAVLGESEQFFIPAYGQVATSTAYPNNRISARCVAISSDVMVYVDNAIQTPSSSLIADLRQRFEEVIQPKIRDVFGEEPDLGPDGESRLTILLTDSMSSTIAGIFYGIDLYSRDESGIQLRESNERKIIYVKYSLSNTVTRFGTIAHEFQHMVNYYQKQRYGGTGTFEAVWLNEGMSKYAEEVCGYGILEGDANTARLIKLSQENFNSLSLTNFTGLNSYGLSYLFVRFLAQENRFGTTYREITRKLVGSALTGKANVAAVTGEAFDLTLARWALCLYLNRYSSASASEYGFAGLNLAGTYNSVTMPGFVAVDARTEQKLSLSADAVRGFVKTSTGETSTSFTVQNEQKGFDLWLFDFRP